MKQSQKEKKSITSKKKDTFIDFREIATCNEQTFSLHVPATDELTYVNHGYIRTVRTK